MSEAYDSLRGFVMFLVGPIAGLR
ncbi:uncharacterized protein ARMOST_20533 [Armillaria ostoyae]|uniref:Uncharacterized protein n=1 Tax=Armillaria ostoyae TaxID=47428 RepID=A0A284S7L5_ARMOS|nr:uncharacterized protein ARMOST_20533 [Armillaria ostoyae]